MEKLSNEEIRERLMDFGLDVGPVVESTRNVYAKKLKRLLDGKPVAATHKNVKDSPSPRSPQKSASRISRVPAKEVPVLSKSQGEHLIIPPPPTSPTKQRMAPETEHRSVRPLGIPAEVPVHIPSKASECTEDPKPLHNSVKLPRSNAFEETEWPPSVTGAYRTSRFPSLQKKEETGKKGDGSDEEDLRGEEFSRILSNRNDDHTYSAARYSSAQTARRLSPGRGEHYSRGRLLESSAGWNASNGYGRESEGLVQTKRKGYGRVVFGLLSVVILAIFIFFVVQNFTALEHGEGNKEEF